MFAHSHLSRRNSLRTAQQAPEARTRGPRLRSDRSGAEELSRTAEQDEGQGAPPAPRPAPLRRRAPAPPPPPRGRLAPAPGGPGGSQLPQPRAMGAAPAPAEDDKGRARLRTARAPRRSPNKGLPSPRCPPSRPRASPLAQGPVTRRCPAAHRRRPGEAAEPPAQAAEEEEGKGEERGASSAPGCGRSVCAARPGGAALRSARGAAAPPMADVEPRPPGHIDGTAARGDTPRHGNAERNGPGGAAASRPGGGSARRPRLPLRGPSSFSSPPVGQRGAVQKGGSATKRFKP